mgnify:FL=1|jgi:predicted ATP-dependent Lon-type protease|tara:strand:- start:909 stop:1154 length:246 start_codon:yes stop_codon:yes gene_type:complete
MQAKEVFTLDDAVEVLLDQVIDNPKAYEDNWKQLNLIGRMIDKYKNELLDEAVAVGKLIKHETIVEVKAHTRKSHKKEWIK